MKDLPNRAGWWKDTADGRIYLFLEKALIEAGGGRPLARILEALEDAGALVAIDPGQKYKRTLCPDGLVRPLYYVDPKKLHA